MGILIEDLSAAASVQADHVIPAMRGGATVKLSASQIADFVTTFIIDGAPGTLDTLNKFAAAIGYDANFSATILEALSNRVRYDAPQSRTDAERLQARANISASPYFRFVQGLNISNNASDANNDIDIAAGSAQNASGVYAANSATMTKRLDASWAAGNNSGGLDTGSKANSTTYHIHCLRKQSDGTFDALFSTSATSPTVPSGYVAVERIGSIRTDGSGNIRAFIKRGKTYYRNDSSTSAELTTSTAWSFSDLTFSFIPSGISVEALLNLTVSCDSGSAGELRIYPQEASENISQASARLYVGSGPSGGASEVRGAASVVTDTQARAKVAFGIAGVASTATIHTNGWVDYTLPLIG